MAMIHNSLEFNKYIYKQLIPTYPIQLAAIKGLNVDTILDIDTSALIICSSRIRRLIKAKYAQNFCATSFDDIIDITLPGAITEEIAELITNFVRNLDNSVEKLYIACDGGDSRSPAIAASILLASGRSDDCIWDNPFYSIIQIPLSTTECAYLLV